MQEIVRHNIQGCTSYVKRDLAKMDCQQVTLHPSDVLYMPKGIIHYATTRANITSTHLTIGLYRQGHTWGSLFQRHCQLAEFDHTCQQFRKLILKVSSTPTGLIWNDLATAPFAQNSFEGICHQLSALINGHHPASLRQLLGQPLHKVNTYESTARELMQLLPRLAMCKLTEVPELLYHRQAHQDLNRNRRSSNYQHECFRRRTCSSAGSCDCDSGKLFCLQRTRLSSVKSLT